MSPRIPRRPLAVAAVIAFAAGLAGCGSGQLGTASVSGKVSFNGAPVPGGTITFYPAGGEAGTESRPASGPIKPDGTFVLTTYEEGDGAVPGKYTVGFSPPPTAEAAAAPEGAHAPPAKPSPFAGLKPMVPEVEVVDGSNEFTVDLAK